MRPTRNRWGRRATGGSPRVDLRVLVVDDGGSAVSAIANALLATGVPCTRIAVGRRRRRRIHPRLLSTGDRARFQAVVLPDPRPERLSEAEVAALRTFERSFGIRQVNANARPDPAVGLEAPVHHGPLERTAARVTEAGRAAGFSYLRGPVPLGADSRGYLSVPRPPGPGEDFETLVEAVPPGGGPATSLVGVHTSGGREELVIAVQQDEEQLHSQLLARGIVAWATRGVHLGSSRNYLSVHIDDLFAPNDRWRALDRAAAAPTIRMVPDDVAHLREWQARHGFVFDLAFNGGWSDVIVAQEGSDPLAETFVEHKADFRWVNHTFTHAFLGCERDVSTTPWRCELDERGEMTWVSHSTIVDEIERNLAWARARGIEVDPGSLVTGEHSGIKALPQQKDDNPFFAPALGDAGVRYIASDRSEEPIPRAVGGAVTVPRYPMGVFFNAATKAEEVEEYCFLERSDAALDPATAFEDHIVPREAAITLRHILENDPRPHYAHQSNVTEDRVLLPLLEAALVRYEAAFEASAPLVQPTFAEAGDVLWKQATWSRRQRRVVGFLRNGRVEIRSSGPCTVPVTVPCGTVAPATGEPFGDDYAGQRSAWVEVGQGTTAVARLPSST